MIDQYDYKEVMIIGYKGDGNTIKHKSIIDISDTWFYEFSPGKFDGSMEHSFNTNSVYLSSEAEDFIHDCLHRANNNYDGLGNTVFTKRKGQIQLLAEELRLRLAEIIEGKDFSGKFDQIMNNDLKNHKAEIIAMIKDLIEWIENLKEDELTVLGIGDKFADLVLGKI